MANFKDSIRKLNSNGGGIPFMEDRTKGEHFPKDSVVTVDAYGYIKGEDGEYIVLSFREFPKNFFFGSSVVTAKFMEIDMQLDEAEKAEMLKEGLPCIFTDRKSKDKKRTYTAVEFYPEDEKVF